MCVEMKEKRARRVPLLGPFKRETCGIFLAQRKPLAVIQTERRKRAHAYGTIKRKGTKHHVPARYCITHSNHFKARPSYESEQGKRHKKRKLLDIQ